MENHGLHCLFVFRMEPPSLLVTYRKVGCFLHQEVGIVFQRLYSVPGE